ncbi:putative MOZ protein represents a chromatin-associated acetyltransferase [Rosellinia necatrix]|uniref:Putative MOZ protein represents a chromatin-associated acetyltransferase n=1 Tax=Rosellinia necatrix TaxID=77044 RepID=A0A1W2TNR9_ROSNE|nr:putative MOZ protein represents a chromatin-associated acetyltransferase [Rosellinia necatrix]
MSTVRLTFLYPSLFRAVRFAESATQPTKTRYRSRSSRPSLFNPHASFFTTSTQAGQASFERHGTAVEPLPVPPNAPNAVKLPQADKAASPSPDPPPPPTETDESPLAGEESKESDAAYEADTPPNDAAKEASQESQNTTATAPPHQAVVNETLPHSGPMEAVLHMPPPDGSQHLHIYKPTYVHHFDSYTLVKQLQGGGYTQAQAITVMKAVRAILAQNLDVAQEGLVGKSDVDNETYLFRAACSELSSEVTNNRRIADEEIRQQRTQLLHEVDILNQRMSQDIMTLKDDVKGMFNDRRMNVREEQRNMESAIQQVNLKISVTLNSDSRSEIEGLRWVLIKRSVLGILFMALLTLSTIRYATYLGHKKQKEAKEKLRQAEERKRTSGRVDNASSVDAVEILAAN